MQRRIVRKTYTWGVIAIGLLLIVWGLYTAIRQYIPHNTQWYVTQTLFLTVICAACRSLPVFLSNNKAMDLSVISILMTYLTMGTAQAIVVFALSSLFTFSFNEQGDKRVVTIYNNDPEKSLFNIGSVIIAIAVPGAVVSLTGWSPGEFVYPDVLIVTVIFALLTFLINALIMMGLFSMIDGLGRYEAMQILLGLIPNVLPVMPLGYVMALFLRQESGMLVVLFMLLPLLLARHGWKLYVDSINQQQKLVDALNVSMEARDAYTSGHAQRVRDYATMIARELGLSGRDIYSIRRGALLHDVGKVGVSDTVLLKPGKLTPEEREHIEAHPVIGASITEQVKFDSEIIDMVRHHHERFDGNGYPDRLKGEEISRNARILAVADTLDAMLSDRPYRKGMAPERALSLIQEASGTQFDPQMVDALMRAAQREENKFLKESKAS